jgi:hypothetical protein
MLWISSNLNFLLASPLASVRCSSLGSRLSPFLVLDSTVAILSSLSAPIALLFYGLPISVEQSQMGPVAKFKNFALKELQISSNFR